VTGRVSDRRRKQMRQVIARAFLVLSIASLLADNGLKW
jgi:hypothetical protein